MIHLDAQGLPGISSFHDLILPMLSLSEQVQYIFSSTIDREARYHQVSVTLASSIERLPSLLKEDATEQTKKIMALAKGLLNTKSFGAIFDFQTRAQVTLNEYSQETPFFIERMDDVTGPWRAKPYHWFFLLIKQDRIHCAEQVFDLLPPMGDALKSSTSLVLALAYVRQGDTEKALELLPNISKPSDQKKVYRAVADKFCEEKSYDKVQELIDSKHFDAYLLENIAELFSKHGQFDRALSIANGLTRRKYNLLRNIVFDMIDYGIATNDDTGIDRALSTLDDPSFPNRGQSFLMYNIAKKMIDYGIKANDDQWISRVLKMSKHPCFDQGMTGLFKRDIAEKMLFHGMKYNDDACIDRARALAFSCTANTFDLLTSLSHERLASDPLTLIRNYYHSRDLQKAFDLLDSLKVIDTTQPSSEQIETQGMAIDFLTKKLFEDALIQEIFDFATRKNITSSNSPILMCCKKLLDLLSDEGRFDEVFLLLRQLTQTQETLMETLKALCRRYWWNLQHPENPHVFRLFNSPLPEPLIEALAAGRYAEVVSRLKEFFPQENEARQAFYELVYFLPYLKAAHLVDHIPRDWKGTDFERIVFETLTSKVDETRDLHDLLPT